MTIRTMARVTNAPTSNRMVPGAPEEVVATMGGVGVAPGATGPLVVPPLTEWLLARKKARISAPGPSVLGEFKG